MAYSLMRESRVVVVYEGRAYGFDALANYNAETSFREYKTLRRTLHSRSNYSHSKITAQDPTSISLAVNFANGGIESNFFDWLGFSRTGSSISMPKTSNNIEPIMLQIFILTKGVCMQFDYCYVANIDFILENSVPVLNIGIESGKFTEIDQPLDSYTIDQGQVIPFSPLRVSSNGRELPGAISASMSFQQQCSWREDRNIFGIGNIYNNSRAVVNELNASALLSFYYIKPRDPESITVLDSNSSLDLIISNNHISVVFPQSRISKRLSMTDVFRVEYDIISTESSDPVTINFLGENNK